MAPSLVFPPKLKHPFFIENITSPFGSSLKDLSVWGFGPAKVASQCPRCISGTGVGVRRVSEGGWVLSPIFSDIPLPLPSRLPLPR